MIDEATLAAIGAGIVGFGIVAFVFRVQRELEGRERSLTRRELEVWEGSLPRLKLEVWERSLPLPAMREPRAVHPGAAERGGETGQWANWLPWADRLLIGAVTAAILLVLFPIALAGGVSSLWGEQLPAAACSGSAIALGWLHCGTPGPLHLRFPSPAEVAPETTDVAPETCPR